MSYVIKRSTFRLYFREVEFLSVYFDFSATRCVLSIVKATDSRLGFYFDGSMLNFCFTAAGNVFRIFKASNFRFGLKYKMFKMKTIMILNFSQR